MNIEASLIEAEVYFSDPVKERYFVKITFLGTGMYINSFSVQTSQFEGKPYWVQPPKHRQGARWVPTVDFDKSYDLWQIIEIKALSAVEDYRNNKPAVTSNSKDIVLTDISDEPIDLSDIPF